MQLLLFDIKLAVLQFKSVQLAFKLYVCEIQFSQFEFKPVWLYLQL